MTFDNITGSKKLWSVRLDGEEDNEFLKLFYDWSDVMWLRSFFKENINDLSAYFKITDINQAIKDTIEDSKRLRCVIMDISPEADLSRLKRTIGHSSWLRLYAIKLTPCVYIITGGAIKLTATMQEREHTRKELVKMDKVRRYLLEENIIDDDGFIDYMSEL